MPGDEVFERACRHKIEHIQRRGPMDEVQVDRPGECWVFIDETGEGVVGPGPVRLLRLGRAEPLRDQEMPVVRVAGV
jgi:hypothetical protein